ncbi:porimin [Sminthopsis crassicaudata]|uniref:porimin n=1 Tax=Sminthopsis crassicaudata TaxID=9301 RepID=UPI003D68082C
MKRYVPPGLKNQDPPAPAPRNRACLRREAEEPAFTTPSIARWAPAALRSAPPRVHLALPGSPSRPPSAGSRAAPVARPLPCSGAPEPYLVIRRERGASERARQPARSQRCAQEERKGPRCGLRSALGERGLALAAAPAQSSRHSVPPSSRWPVSFGTMRLSAVATSAPLLVAALQVLFLLGAAQIPEPSTNQTKIVNTANDTMVQPNLTSSTLKPVTILPSAITSAPPNNTTEAPQVTTRSSTPERNSTTPPTTTRSAPHTTTDHSASKSSASTTSNSTVTTTAALTTATANINAQISKGSKFDIGSFVGGIVLTLGVLSILYIGCKTYYSRGIRYRTIDEHDAII